MKPQVETTSLSESSKWRSSNPRLEIAFFRRFDCRADRSTRLVDSHGILSSTFLDLPGCGDQECQTRRGERPSPSPHLKLKVKLQRQLNLARIAGASGIISENRGECVGHLAKRTRRGNIRIGIPEVGMVEGVEEFRPELQLISFRELELVAGVFLFRPMFLTISTTLSYSTIDNSLIL